MVTIKPKSDHVLRLAIKLQGRIMTSVAVSKFGYKGESNDAIDNDEPSINAGVECMSPVVDVFAVGEINAADVFGNVKEVYAAWKTKPDGRRKRCGCGQ